VVEIAAALRYADATAFTRAFRGWAGTTPAAWRSEQHAPLAVPRATRSDGG
jgi:AraC-like DNA-binding protein